MSMNISGSGNSAGDTEMSEATSADQELALGVLLYLIDFNYLGFMITLVLLFVENDLQVQHEIYVLLFILLLLCDF